MPTIRENDYGFLITATHRDRTGAVVDISGATTIQFLFTNPAGRVFTKAAPDVAFVSDGTDGQLQYTTEQSFFTPTGRWTYQTRVSAGSFQYTSKPNPLDVE